MTKRMLRQPRQPEPERPLADYTDAELQTAIVAALDASVPGAKGSWPAMKRGGELIIEKRRRIAERGQR